MELRNRYRYLEGQRNFEEYIRGWSWKRYRQKEQRENKQENRTGAGTAWRRCLAKCKSVKAFGMGVCKVLRIFFLNPKY